MAAPLCSLWGPLVGGPPAQQQVRSGSISDTHQVCLPSPDGLV